MPARKYLTLAMALIALGLFANLLWSLFSRGFGLENLARNLFSEDVGLALFYFLLALGLWAVLRHGRALFSRRNQKNLLLAVASTILALLLFDLLLWPFNLVFNAATLGHFNFQDMRRLATELNDQKGTWWSKVQWMQKDDQLGYRPLMGPQYTYSETGTLHNDYRPEKPAGVTRALFAGDSICAQAYLTDNVKKLHQKPDFEYWTSGVYGYSTHQELNYFERFTRRIKPDIVVLEFCLNDWDGTPVILQDQDSHTILANLYVGESHLNYWLFRHSTLYRVWLSLLASATDRASLAGDVARGLAKFKEYGQTDGFRLRVVVYPELDRLANWPRKFLRQREDIKAILASLELPFYDAAPLLDQALADRPREWARLEPKDHFHPSWEFSQMIAREILKQGFLEP